MRFFRTILCAIAAMAAGAAPLTAAEFTTSDKLNEDTARRLNIPVFFAVPASARLALPKNINTTDRLIDFKHPGAKGLTADIGLRLVMAKRQGFSKRMAQSGLLQTGDILLTFRPEWGGAGTYPNIQMGVSHTGLAYVKDGTAYHIDNPMDAEFLGGNFRGDFTGQHYREIKYMHIIRPRSLTDAQRTAIAGWASRLVANARRVYPSEVSFNQDYNAPKYEPGKKPEFVKHLAQSALNQSPGGQTSMYCSEFVWSLLALRGCDPAKTADVFKGSGVPSCISPVMTPMKATGNYISRRTRGSSAGLSDGPLLIIDAMKLGKPERDIVLHSVFVENPNKAALMSVGHREVAKQMQPKFAPLEEYYKAASDGGFHRIQAWFIGNAFRRALPDNYSPTSYLINTLLPINNSTRTMDYVATVAFEG